MCGIAGFITLEPLKENHLKSIVKNMASAITHRGPDDSGEWVDMLSGVALAHRRLSVIDTSHLGHQPMISSSNRYILIFNGEIYNHTSIRKKINNYRWIGSSDTETLIAAIETWGVEKALKISSGMFSIALWDSEKKELTLARDRIGEKPLYYGWQGKSFMFASELKALRTHPHFKSEINTEALPLYFQHGYFPAPQTPWAGIHKLIPGTLLKLNISKGHIRQKSDIYWSLSRSICTRNRQINDPIEAINAVEDQLKLSVANQMISDVPLGAFLSGGIDSSAIVSIMQSQSTKPIKTYTVGFNESTYNEAIHAKEIANFLGTDHTELFITPKEAYSTIQELPDAYDEPFGDSSAIPTILVSKLARNSVTVALSGDGGDEIFGGYSHYFDENSRKIWNTLHILPKALRNLTIRTLQSQIPNRLDKIINLINKNLATNTSQYRSIESKAERLLAFSNKNSFENYYATLRSIWVNSPTTIDVIDSTSFPYCSIYNHVEKMMFFDTCSYLPDDIMQKVDRASMKSSLECRAPFLDHNLIELAWQIPPEIKFPNNNGKWILKKILEKHIPKNLFERPKKGFSIPVDIWIKGPLRDWAEDLIDYSSLSKQGFLNPDIIHMKWNQHINMNHNWRDCLWTILMFQAWLRSVNKS